MSGLLSRRKGAGAEREVVALLQPALERVYQQLAYDWPVLAPYLADVPRLQRNAMQADGGGADIAGLEWLALEVKCQEKLAVPTWWKQCLRQAKRHQTPVLVYKRNGAAWRVRMQVETHVGQRRTLWAPVVEMEFAYWLAYFSLRAYDEAGQWASYQHAKANNMTG